MDYIIDDNKLLNTTEISERCSYVLTNCGNDAISNSGNNLVKYNQLINYKCYSLRNENNLLVPVKDIRMYSPWSAHMFGDNNPYTFGTRSIGYTWYYDYHNDYDELSTLYIGDLTARYLTLNNIQKDIYGLTNFKVPDNEYIIDASDLINNSPYWVNSPWISNGKLYFQSGCDPNQNAGPYYIKVYYNAPTYDHYLEYSIKYVPYTPTMEINLMYSYFRGDKYITAVHIKLAWFRDESLYNHYSVNPYTYSTPSGNGVYIEEWDWTYGSDSKFNIYRDGSGSTDLCDCCITTVTSYPNCIGLGVYGYVEYDDGTRDYAVGSNWPDQWWYVSSWFVSAHNGRSRSYYLIIDFSGNDSMTSMGISCNYLYSKYTAYAYTSDAYRQLWGLD